MKNKILLIIVFVIISMMLVIPSKVSARTMSIGDTINISENGMSSVDDVYCVAHGKNFGGIYGMNYEFSFKVKAYVTIEGTHAQGISSSGQTIELDNETNAIIAAILGGPLTRGYGSYNNYSEAQKALYTYWNTWVGAVGSQYGFSADSANDNVNGSTFVEKAKEAAKEQDFKVTIYLLVPTGTGAACNVQELIAVDAQPYTPNIPDIPNEEPGKTTVNGKVTISGFVWEDIANNKSNTINSQYEEGDIRLQGIKVHWKGPNGEEIASTETGNDGSYKLETTLELYNHPYSIKDKTKYDLLNNSYIEFEYNGLKYTTVAYNGNLSNEISSKAKENEVNRTDLDNKFDKVENRAVYDGSNAIISGLPNTQITDANYASEFAVSASTGNIVSGLLNIAESNSWIARKTFCSNHCNAEACTHEVATIPITREYGEAYYHIDRWEDQDGDGIDETHIQNDYRKDSATVNVHIWCYGDPTFDDDPHEILTSEDYAKYSKAPIGNEFNSYNSHYYAADEIDGPTIKDCLSSTEGIWEWDIKNMNLGLVKREQPDGAVISDIEKVRVIMKDQEYTYIYGNRGITDTDAVIDYKVKWQNKYNTQVYSRPVNPADIAYINYNNTEDMKVYVTYNIKIKNQSNTLPIKINSIINYYDPNYEIYANGQTNSSTSTGWTTSESTNNGYKIAYNNSLAGIILQPGTASEVVKIEFEINQETIKGLLNEDATLNNFSEIFSFTTFYGEKTMCAETESAASKGKTGSQYAGIDKDSTPGTAIPGGTKPFEAYDSSKEEYEDDTDKAPSFLLEKDTTPDEPKFEYKIISGIVYEDQQTAESSATAERLGNGVKDENEKGVQNVKVELLNAETGKVADLYYIQKNDGSPNTAEKITAVTYTDANGNYSFGKQGEYGVVVDNYIVRYTYGNKADELDGNRTTIDGGSTFINARNYKSTIITESNVKGVMQGNGEEKWHLNMNENVDASIAVDDITERLSIDSLKYDNYNNEINMSSLSKAFKVQIEYTQEPQANVDENGGEFKHDWSVFDFGIIERPREDIVINKSISKIKVTLANGQVLIEGDPRTTKMNYVKAMGFDKHEDANGRDIATKNAPDRLLSMEIDTELIQGSTLEVWYAITVTNNSELDYEYENDQKYYYYGDKNGLNVITNSVEIVADYMNSNLVCDVGDKSPNVSGINNQDWKKYASDGTAITADVLKDNGYISYNTDTTSTAMLTYETLKEQGQQVLITDTFKNVEPNGGTKTSTLYASKLLANQEENHLYDNHVEILQLNGKIARTISGVDDNRSQVVKSYQPGNYIPALTGEHQQDEDRVRIVITPPTGTATYIISYVIAGGIGLIAMIGVIAFIKKHFRK